MEKPSIETDEALARFQQAVEQRLKQVHTGRMGRLSSERASHFQALINAKRYREVIEEAADLLDDPIIACQVAGCHHVLGNLDEALSTYLLALSNTGSDHELHSMILSNIATWLDDRRLYSTALTVWRNAATLDPDNPLAYLNMMRRLLVQEEDDKAREHAEKLLARLQELREKAPDKFRKVANSTISVLSKADQMERFRSSTDPKTVEIREALLRLTANTSE